jgi:predicted kinase
MGKYQPDDRMFVYQELARLAELDLTESRNVIIDATFSRKNMRDLFTSLAYKLSVPLHFIWVYANEELIKERLRDERQDSEADFSVYRKVRNEFDHFESPFVRIESTNENVESMLEVADRFISGDESK